MPEHAEDEVAGQPQVSAYRLAWATSSVHSVPNQRDPGAGPAARPAEAGTQEDEAGPESRRPKPGTSRAATVKDEVDPGEGTPVALFQPKRGARGRDG